jgi:hypothetical protein
MRPAAPPQKTLSGVFHKYHHVMMHPTTPTRLPRQADKSQPLPNIIEPHIHAVIPAVFKPESIEVN